MPALNKTTAEYRLRFLASLAIFFVCINFAVRFSLQVGFSDVLPFTTAMLPALLKGFLNDLAALVFVLLLPATLVLLPSNQFLQRRAGKIYAVTIMFIFSAIFIFTAFSEYLFWDEFSSRFNFIAVDYLIYTTELMRNMVESYPLPLIFTAVLALAVVTTWFLWRKVNTLPRKEYTPKPGGTVKNRLVKLGGLYSAAAMLFILFTPVTGSQDRFWNEYSKNGVYEMFSAYLNNQLDYRAFYKTIDTQKAFALMKDEVMEDNASFVSEKDDHIFRIIKSDDSEKHPNVILVIMESMGSRWLGEYTPNLVSLAQESLVFSNMMSTGSRTVRGIEAIMLSVPPTPGNSIVRRPDNGRLFTLGTMFRERGYDRDFIYGGVGYFDNMNAFFEGNGYTVTDKLDFSEQSKTFANAWGQCDEDLYSESLRMADRSFAAGRPFHQVLLTTSNHRPFTYPENKVELTPGSGRRGAIQYSDYAIGEFIELAKTKPWFDNTIFVFVADHPSSIAGKTEIPADAYKIICMMYAPKFFEAQSVETLCSQIDVAPTLLASLDWSYPSTFFGTDALVLPQEEGRAWISTYQLLGFRTNDHLVVLKPDGQADVTGLQPAQLGSDTPDAQDGAEDTLVSRTVASYQCAYDLFVGKRLKENTVLPHMSKLLMVEQ